MNRRKLKLLKYFLNHCDDGYKVLEIKNITKIIRKYKYNLKLFEQDIEFLKKNKFIDVKYIDNIELCVAILDNSHILQENLKSEMSVNRKYLITTIINIIFSGLMAFIGAFLAIIMTR